MSAEKPPFSNYRSKESLSRRVIGKTGCFGPTNRHPHGSTTSMQKTARMVAVNDRGLPIGESHPRAVLTDEEIGWLLELRAEGFSYSWLAGKFEVSKSCVAKIVRGEHRGQIATAWVKREKPKVYDGVSKAAANSNIALGVSNSGITLCMQPGHVGVNTDLPTSERVLLRPGVWVCTKCAEKAGRNYRRVRGAGSGR